MKKVIINLLIISTIVLFAYPIYAANSVYPPYNENNLHLSIWNIDFDFRQDRYTYVFIIDARNSNVGEIENLIIETDHGNIECESIGASTADNIGYGYLVSNNEINTLDILNASVIIQGIRYDIIKNISIDEFHPLNLIISNDNNRSCPNRHEELPNAEGILKEYYCSDHCFIVVGFNDGQEEIYFADYYVQDLIDRDSVKIGDKIFIKLVLEQYIDGGGDCLPAKLATLIGAIE